MPTHAVPTFDALLWPTLQALKQIGGSGSNQEIFDSVVGIMGLPEEVQRVPRGTGTEQATG
jgi:restriction system protein